MIVPDVGGAFGSKGAPAPETMLVAAAAMLTGRAVKWAEDREENFVASYQGRGVEAEVELALDADGEHARGARADLRRPRRLPDADHRDPAAHDGDADVRCLRRPGCRRGGPGHAHEQGADRPVPRRRPARGRLLPGVHRRHRGPRAGHRPARAAPPQPDPRVPVPRRRSAGPTTPATTRAASSAPRRSSRPERATDGERVVGTGFGMYVERAGGQFESAEAELLPNGPAARPERLVPARPGPRHDLRADRRRPASGSSSTTSSSASATRARFRAGSARSPAARWRWAGRPSRRRSTR